ncbi:hypothetical protein AMTRI_Chr02g218050 [Amborella trichopoda]
MYERGEFGVPLRYSRKSKMQRTKTHFSKSERSTKTTLQQSSPPICNPRDQPLQSQRSH